LQKLIKLSTKIFTKMGQKFLQIFLWFSATDIELFKRVRPAVKGTRIAFSLFVMIIGIFAFMTSSYFIRTMFAIYDQASKSIYVSPTGWWVSMIGGLLWATLVVLVDRMIISSKNKIMAALRIPLAVAIGFIIAIPLETQFFNGKIEKHLLKKSKEENQPIEAETYAEVNRLEGLLEVARSSVQSETAEVSRWRDQMYAQEVGRGYLAGKGPDYTEANENYKLHTQLMQQAIQRENDYQTQLTAAREVAKDEFRLQKIDQSWDFPTRYEALCEIQAESDYLKRIGWGLTILFILIEIIPAIMKMLKDDDSYDSLVMSRDSLEQHVIAVLTNDFIDQVENNKGNVINMQQLWPKNAVKNIAATI